MTDTCDIIECRADVSHVMRNKTHWLQWTPDDSLVGMNESRKTMKALRE